jgi:hypothetical protein
MPSEARCEVTRAVLVFLLAMSLSGCALVQWLPMSACDHVRYERTGNDVEVEASCRL